MASQFVRSTFDRAGLLEHPVKSIWDPTQRLPWLGFVIDLALGQIERSWQHSNRDSIKLVKWP